MTDDATPQSTASEGAGEGLAIFGEFDPAGRESYQNAVVRFRENNIVLPTFAQLRDPSTIPGPIVDQLGSVEKDAADPRNLFRVHWFNEHADEPGDNFPGLSQIPFGTAHRPRSCIRPASKTSS